MAVNNLLQIEVAYARQDHQKILEIEVERNTTIQQAIEQSSILQLFPEIDLSKNSIGVFSKQRNLSDLVQDRDRIEIYKPLIIDPKEARRAKARKKKCL